MALNLNLDKMPLDPKFNPACPSCGRRNLVWSIREADGAPVGTCSECDDSLTGSPDDEDLRAFVVDHLR